MNLAQPSCSISHYKAIIEEKTAIYNDLFLPSTQIGKTRQRAIFVLWDEVLQAAWIAKRA